MADSLSQDQQQGKLTTPLGENTLALVKLSAIEGLSELFEIRIEAVSTEADLDFASLLGLGSTVELKTQDDKSRHFHGVMTEARWAGTSDRPLSLPVRAEAVALVPDPNLGLPHLRPDDADRHHQAGVLRPRLLRFPRRDDRLAADARILRPIPRDRFQFRLSADGGIRRLLFLRAFRRKAHAGARRRQVEPQAGPRPVDGALQPHRGRRAERTAISRDLVARAAGAERRLRSRRLRLQETVRQSARPVAEARRLRATIPWRCSTIPTATSTPRATISWIRASARTSRNTGRGGPVARPAPLLDGRARRRCFPAGW